MATVKKILFAFIIVNTGLCAAAQNVYSPIPIRKDTAIQWSARSEKLINLAGNGSAQSLKKFYLDKIRTRGVTAWEMNDGDKQPSSYHVFLPSLATQDWLKGLGIEVPETKSRKEWFFYDKTMAKDDPDRYRYRAGTIISA